MVVLKAAKTAVESAESLVCYSVDLMAVSKVGRMVEMMAVLKAVRRVGKMAVQLVDDSVVQTVAMMVD